MATESTGMSDQRAAAVAAIYREEYAERYRDLYITPWPRKHQLNAANLSRILEQLGPRPRWLDFACGPAWQFSMFPGRARQVGVDLSHAQLARARRNAPGASFVQANMAQFGLQPGTLDLVTNFWAGYCYLGTGERIAALVQRAIEGLAEGGALYIEVLLPRDLESFNRSRFSSRTGFAVTPLSADYTEWRYEDTGGCHVMTSPPLEMFTGLVSPHFREIEARHDGAFIVHLIATGRRR